MTGESRPLSRPIGRPPATKPKSQPPHQTFPPCLRTSKKRPPHPRSPRSSPFNAEKPAARRPSAGAVKEAGRAPATRRGGENASFRATCRLPSRKKHTKSVRPKRIRSCPHAPHTHPPCPSRRILSAPMRLVSNFAKNTLHTASGRFSFFRVFLPFPRFSLPCSAPPPPLSCRPLFSPLSSVAPPSRPSIRRPPHAVTLSRVPLSASPFRSFSLP